MLTDDTKRLISIGLDCVVERENAGAVVSILVEGHASSNEGESREQRFELPVSLSHNLKQHTRGIDESICMNAMEELRAGQQVNR